MSNVPSVQAPPSASAAVQRVGLEGSVVALPSELSFETAYVLRALRSGFEEHGEEAEAAAAAGHGKVPPQPPAPAEGVVIRCVAPAGGGNVYS